MRYLVFNDHLPISRMMHGGAGIATHPATLISFDLGSSYTSLKLCGDNCERQRAIPPRLGVEGVLSEFESQSSSATGGLKRSRQTGDHLS